MTDDMWCLVHFTHLLPCGHYFILLFPLNWPGALASEEGTKLSTWVIKLYLLFNIWIVQVEPDLSYYEKHTEKFLKIHSILCQNILMTIIQDKNSGTPWWFYDWKDFFSIVIFGQEYFQNTNSIEYENISLNVILLSKKIHIMFFDGKPGLQTSNNENMNHWVACFLLLKMLFRVRDWRWKQ